MCNIGLTCILRVLGPRDNFLRCSRAWIRSQSELNSGQLKFLPLSVRCPRCASAETMQMPRLALSNSLKRFGRWHSLDTTVVSICGVQQHKYKAHLYGHLACHNDRHRIIRPDPVGSSDPRVESNLDQHQELTSDDVFVDRYSIYVLSDPLATLPTPSVPYPSTLYSMPAAFSPLSRLMPRA